MDRITVDSGGQVTAIYLTNEGTGMHDPMITEDTPPDTPKVVGWKKPPGEESLGQELVRLSPSDPWEIREVKARCAELIDFLGAHAPSGSWRDVSIAREKLESAAMWAVKAVTK